VGTKSTRGVNWRRTDAGSSTNEDWAGRSGSGEERVGGYGAVVNALYSAADAAQDEDPRLS